MPYCYLESYELEISPKPTGISEQTDAEGNMILFCWFDGTHAKLEISTNAVVKLGDYDPFRFIIYPMDYMKLPFTYAGTEGMQLRPALICSRLSASLKEYVNRMMDESKYETLTLIVNLTRQIHEDFIVAQREMGVPYTAGKTFRKKHGSCRDLAWMEMQMLRYLGIASRFVSGYCYIPGADNNHELHAWVEAYLPGAGWIGLDPSHGIITGNTYIPLASSIHFDSAMPVTGTIRGGADSTLKAILSIEQL